MRLDPVIRVFAAVVYIAVANSAFADLASDFRKESLEGWATIQQASRSLQLKAECVTTTIRPDGAETRAQERWVYKRSGPWELVEKDSADKNTFQSLVFARNTRYTLKLSKDPGAREWLIRDASFDRKDRENVDVAFIGVTQRAPDSAWALPFAECAKIVRSPNFKLISCVEEGGAKENQQLVRVEFEFHPMSNELDLSERVAATTIIESLSGRLVMDRKQYWALTHYDLRLHGGMVGNPKLSEFAYTADAKYRPVQAPSGAIIPVPSELNLEMKSGGATIKKGIKLFEASLQDAPEEAFTLAAYGLPEVGEPPAGSDNERSVAAYIFIAASVLGIAALLLARVRFSQAKQGKQPEQR
jgi:hypothetical protein